MPAPKKGEKLSDYMKRAIPVFLKEGLTLKQAKGKAYGWWMNENK